MTETVFSGFNDTSAWLCWENFSFRGKPILQLVEALSSDLDLVRLLLTTLIFWQVGVCLYTLRVLFLFYFRVVFLRRWLSPFSVAAVCWCASGSEISQLWLRYKGGSRWILQTLTPTRRFSLWSSISPFMYAINAGFVCCSTAALYLEYLLTLETRFDRRYRESSLPRVSPSSAKLLPYEKYRDKREPWTNCVGQTFGYSSLIRKVLWLYEQLCLFSLWSFIFLLFRHFPTVYARVHCARCVFDKEWKSIRSFFPLSSLACSEIMAALLNRKRNIINCYESLVRSYFNTFLPNWLGEVVC